MAEDASPHHQAEARSQAAAWWGGGISIFLLAYILSPAPLAWVYERFGWGSPQWPKHVYAPLIVLYDRFEPVKNFYDGYAKLLGLDHM
ncbi:hypothetical protein [Roseimicrobium sp. ORNL1]|uniref:hypothetical protein n=1 Tax=Roseimicrobium sp. ORNL1 TaxID=2711231 RepID=UPI0013E14628|nr:hypothetical protein [Roseimicrobium sp. ORNL1]QIF05282.1 hypothetical protein G5S37_28495 [Roseimicrobium sp. ORNL1]